MIPKIIHTCWFCKDPNADLPEKVRKCINSWKKYCPDYQIKVWTISDWNFGEFRYARECWEAGVASYAYLSNLFRFWVLHEHGGVYLEADVELKRGLSDLLDINPDKVHFGMINPNEAGGCFIAGPEKNYVSRYFIENVFTGRRWINADNSLNIYHDTGEIGRELEKLLGRSLPGIDIVEPFVFRDVVLYPKNYFYVEKKDCIYGCHLGTLSHYRKVSIIMPVWNSAKYLREAIDSVLSQDFQDFELLCIDDGSLDNSAEIINSYNDDRVVYIKKQHSGIVDSLIFGLNRAIGIYIVRFDSDDIMLPGRLRHQYEYMESHKDIDILGSGFQWGNGKEEPEFFRCPERKLTINDFRNGNLISHPSTIFRASSIKKLPYTYENYFQGCEDFKLWLHALKHGLTVATEPTPVIIYRQHREQVTQKESYQNSIGEKLRRVHRLYHLRQEEINEKPKLTCIIPFQNEGYEIERTVANIRATVGNKVEIILINDKSYDGYDYEWIADAYGCKYFVNQKNLGVAGSRNYGVSLTETPYFLLLDGHMRFYEDNWHTKLIRALETNPGCLVSSNTTIITRDEETGLYVNEEGSSGRTKFGSFGARINMDEHGWEYTAKWTSKKLEDTCDLIPISCCMGAVYAMSKKDWHKLGGLNGLIKYGLDEPLISLKVWLSGGKVLLFKDWGVGHLYRGKSPYEVPLSHLDQNQIYLINLFTESPEEIKRLEKNLEERVGKFRFNLAMEEFKSRLPEFTKFKDYFYEKVAKKSLGWFLENINNKTV